MSHLASLKSAKSLADVAQLVGFRAAALSYILYKIPVERRYFKFEIAKRAGGTRKISAPAPQLKLVQRRLADLLQNCADEINHISGFSDSIAHGFKRKKSIVTNAKRHRRRRYVLNIDLRDFFPSINFGRVRGFFIKDKNFALDHRVATVIAQIACYENSLPQGSPCSPVISNLIGHVLDIHLAKFALKNGCTYTRYADDLTFSTNKARFPEEICCISQGSPHTWVPGDRLAELLNSSGFAINQDKTRMQYRDSRQEVTGLIVNRKLNVRCEYRHLVRALVHRLVNTGSFDVSRTSTDAQGKKNAVIRPGTHDQLHGMLGFIDEVDKYNRALTRQYRQTNDGDNLSSKELVYRRFLLFICLFAATRPVIICEGPTDNIYLLHAIRSLAMQFTTLASISQDGKIVPNIRVLKYADSGTGRILGIRSGGSANLCKLIRTYHKEKQKFKGPGLTHPVIVLIDNDGGAKPVLDAVEQITKLKATRNEQFLHATGNLYVVPTPCNDATKTSRIEDCFDEDVKATVIDGKTFDPGSKINTSTKYGKTVFAHKVVAKQASTINFAGFAPLLTRIVSVIEAHQQKNITAQNMEGIQPQ